MTQSTDIQELRQHFQEIIGDSEETPFCCTEAEAEEWLSLALAEASVVIAAFKATRQYLDKEAQVFHSYQEDEICFTLVPRFIKEELGRLHRLSQEKAENELRLSNRTCQISANRTCQISASRKKQEHATRSSTGRYGSRENVISEVSRRLGHPLTVSEFQIYMNLANNQTAILLQASRNTAKYSKGTSKEFTLKKLECYCKREAAKATKNGQI